MATKPAIATDVVNRLLYGHGEGERYTQETPILAEVWQCYAAFPGEPQDLLITPLNSSSAVALLRSLIEDAGEARQDLLKRARFAPLQSFLAARLTFQDLNQYLLPRTIWARTAWKTFTAKGLTPDFGCKAFWETFVSALTDEGWEAVGPSVREEADAALGKDRLRGDLLDIARILTLTATIYVADAANLEGDKAIEDARDLAPHREDIIARIGSLMKLLPEIAKAAELDQKAGEKTPLIWRISNNRPIRLADDNARSTVKADAAYRLFDVKCQDITWAVIDSGVDHRHEAFLVDPLDRESGSRVCKTYDFSILRQLLDPAYDPDLGGVVTDNPVFDVARERSGLTPEKAKTHLENIYQSYRTQLLDWSSIEPLLTVADPETPFEGHGTHVAGIIGADSREEIRPPDAKPEDKPDRTKIKLSGVCPDIRLMDFRILSGTIEDTEFAVIGALQLVRYLNSHNQHIVVHGVNLSLSIPHVVESYACGRTPVCDECERLVGAGVTVVAAAGNNGYQRFLTEKGTFRGYATVSITDPGNADAVITVGATHRRDPHTYGISYFSSRGPTGDGRLKPDIVAPGERIESTLPNHETGTLDGTSQAAPHVSGAAAMLMARYPELNRQPRRIKEILCSTATDLGRERAFQGHGLLDILRALQSF